MKFEKIVKREDGTRIKFEVSLYVDNFYPYSHRYNIGVQKCFPKKRTWKQAKTEDYTTDELLQAKTEYWQTLKPE